MIKLDPGGQAPILSYNLPEPTSYSARSFVELAFPAGYFKDSVKKKPATSERIPSKDLANITKQEVLDAIATGFNNRALFPNMRLGVQPILLAGAGENREQPERPLGGELGTAAPYGQPRIGGTPRTETTGYQPSPEPEPVVFPQVKGLTADEILAQLKQGRRLNVYKTMFGNYTYNFLEEPEDVRPRLMLVETYRLSSFLGQYGAGRPLKTFSLLPGEKTTISVKSYLKRAEDAKQASSILDSVTEESASDFETSVQNETSNKEEYKQSFEYHADAEAQAVWGWGTAKVSGGVKGGSNSAREEAAKNVTAAKQKHAAKASAKRDVQINTSYDVRTEAGEETSTVREIENINVSRTLNFVFRQMNQEFITLLHLVDVRVAYFNGYAESAQEVPLPRLDGLLDDVLVEANRQEVRDAILEQLNNIFDYQDKHHTFTEENDFTDDQGNVIQDTAYLRIKRDYVSTYQDPTTGSHISVSGIILAADRSVMRTEGVIVEALLGQAEALDSYSQGLQKEAIAEKHLQNSALEKELKKADVARDLVVSKDSDGADIFERVFPCCTPAPFSLRIETEHASARARGPS